MPAALPALPAPTHPPPHHPSPPAYPATIPSPLPQVGRTTLVVAHRLSTVTACASIAAVYRGRVLEQGTHEELLARNGYYTHLWEASKG